MSGQNHSTERSFFERLFHAATFECCAVILLSPLIAFTMERSLSNTAKLTLLLSTIAMIWNVIYNKIFDKLSSKQPIDRTIGTRIIHASIFECGLVFILVPIIAWWFSTSPLEALILDIGLILLFFPYTIGFNWVYDHLRERLMRNRNLAKIDTP